MASRIQQWREDLLGSAVRRVVPIMTHPGIELLGKAVTEVAKDGRSQADVVLSLAKKYPTSAATMMMDLSLEGEAFGAPIRISGGEVPSVSGRIVDSIESAGQLRVPSLNEGRIPQTLLAVRKTAEVLEDRPLFGCCIGPLSLAARLFDVAETMTAMLMEPETIHALLEKTTELLSRYCAAIREAGADGTFIAEPVAGMLPAHLCDTFSSPYVRRIVAAVQDDAFMVVLHNCGDTDSLVMSMESTGAGGLHFGNRCSIVDALEKIDHRRLVMGNLDPVSVFRMGTPEEVTQQTNRLLAKTSAHPNFVISSGCDIPPRTPPANLAAFFDAVKEYNEGN